MCEKRKADDAAAVSGGDGAAVSKKRRITPEPVDAPNKRHDDLIVSRTVFSRIVRDVLKDLGCEEYRLTAEAKEALRKAAHAFVGDTFLHAAGALYHRRGSELCQRDFQRGALHADKVNGLPFDFKVNVDNVPMTRADVEFARESAVERTKAAEVRAVASAKRRVDAKRREDAAFRALERRLNGKDDDSLIAFHE